VRPQKVLFFFLFNFFSFSCFGMAWLIFIEFVENPFGVWLFWFYFWG
jgi:hypothetical protein